MTDRMDDARPIVVDIGSAGIKVGIAGEDSPRGVFPAIRGHRPELYGPTNKEVFESWEIQTGMHLPLRYGYWGGELDNYELVQTTLRHAFEVCGLDPEERTLLISEPVGASWGRGRERMIRDMFENYSVSWLSIVPQPTLALFSTGRTTGFVLESGYAATQFAPIYEGCALQPGSFKIELGGWHVTRFLEDLLGSSSEGIDRYTLQVCYLIDKTVDNMKIEHAYVASDLEEEPEGSEYKNSYGESMTLKSERTRCTEILFNPMMLPKIWRYDWKQDFEGIDKIAFDTIEKCGSELRRDLWSNFVVSGGNTMLKGFCERLESSLRRRSDSPDDIHIVCPDDRVNSVWRGGSMLAMSPHFDQMCVTKEFYYDWGPQRTARAFF